MPHQPYSFKTYVSGRVTYAYLRSDHWLSPFQSGVQLRLDVRRQRGEPRRRLLRDLHREVVQFVERVVQHRGIHGLTDVGHEPTFHDLPDVPGEMQKVKVKYLRGAFLGEPVTSVTMFSTSLELKPWHYAAALCTLLVTYHFFDSALSDAITDNLSEVPT